MITSEGVNYPADIDELPLYISDIVVENPGQGYVEGDTVEGIGIVTGGLGTGTGVEGFGTGFEVQVTDGQITAVNVIPGFAYNGFPELNILSTTGSGAVLRPIMSIVTPQTEVIQVIDCIS